MQKLTEEEQKLFRLYGKLPTHKNVLTKMQKVRIVPSSMRPRLFRPGWISLRVDLTFAAPCI